MCAYFYYGELNFIEMFWGSMKYYCRNNCDYSFTNLLPTVNAALNIVALPTIRKFARKCWRYMDAYRIGLPMHIAEWAVKKRAHRRINMSLVPEFDKY